MNSSSHFAAQRRIGAAYRRGMFHGTLLINLIWIGLGLLLGVFR